MDTIETGIRTTISNDQIISQVANLLHANDINHLQIIAHSPEDIDKSIRVLQKLKAPYLELSCFYKPLDPNTQENDLLSAISKCKEHHIKYLCVPIEFTTDLKSIGKLISTANDLHIFVCLEAQIDESDHIDVFNAHKKNFKSDFLLLSLNVRSLKELINFSSIIKQARGIIGIISVFVDDEYIHSQSSTDHFVKFLESIFMLPFKQQPLIFTNPPKDLSAVYERFYDVVDEQNYWYI